jgi:hypothetical protein
MSKEVAVQARSISNLHKQELSHFEKLIENATLSVSFFTTPRAGIRLTGHRRQALLPPYPLPRSSKSAPMPE